MATFEEQAVPKNPDLSLAQKKFLLSVDDDLVSPAEKEKVRKELLEAIDKDNMLPFYQSLCEQLKWTPDAQLVNKMKDENEKKLKQLADTITDAVANLGETEVREGYLAKSEYLVRIGEKAKALEACQQTMEKTVAQGQKLDIIFTLIRMGFFWQDYDIIKRNIEKAKTLIEQGGDWDRRNRLKVYEGLYFASVRKFKEASALFLEALATFTSYELFPYNDFIFYTVVVSIVSVDRVTLKKKVVDASEILSVIRDIGELSDFLNSLYNSNYSRFFVCLANITDKMKTDRYLAPHARFFCREMRIVAYSQLLDSYRSVRLDSMADAFGISSDFLDRELSRFVSSGRLHCKIDKVAGIVETTRPGSKDALYLETIKQGEGLLNRVSKLSRIVNL